MNKETAIEKLLSDMEASRSDVVLGGGGGDGGGGDDVAFDGTNFGGGGESGSA